MIKKIDKLSSDGKSAVRVITNKINELIDRVNELENKPEQPKRWKPKFGESYYYVKDYENAVQVAWEDDGIDQRNYAVGNCFRTKEEAESAAEKMKALLLSLHE